MEKLTRQTKWSKVEEIENKHIYINYMFEKIELELQKSDEETKLLFKIFKERVNTHNSKIQSLSTRWKNKGTID